MKRRWEMIGAPDCPILFRRTLLSTRFGKLLVHRFVAGAGREDFHDHPAPFVTLVLRGGYDDVTPCWACTGPPPPGRMPLPGALWIPVGEPRAVTGYDIVSCPHCGGHGSMVDRVRAPAVRARRATHTHVTAVHRDGAWSVVLMGRKRRAWGFLRAATWWPFRDYEARFGSSFRCDDGIVVSGRGDS